METTRINLSECPHCNGTGIVNISSEGGTVYCTCPSGDDAKQYEKNSQIK